MDFDQSDLGLIISTCGKMAGSAFSAARDKALTDRFISPTFTVFALFNFKYMGVGVG